MRIIARSSDEGVLEIRLWTQRLGTDAVSDLPQRDLILFRDAACCRAMRIIEEGSSDRGRPRVTPLEPPAEAAIKALETVVPEEMVYHIGRIAQIASRFLQF